jgi:hypothetical protein
MLQLCIHSILIAYGNAMANRKQRLARERRQRAF